METNGMNVRFTNTYTTREETDRQLYRRIRRLPRILALIVGTVFFAYIVFMLVRLIRAARLTGEPLFADSNAMPFLLGFAMYVLLIVYVILTPGLFAKRQARRLSEAYHTEHITVRAAFTDEAIEFHNETSNADMHLPYDALNLLTESKDLYLIRTKHRQIIALSKNGFAGTDERGFQTFMTEKCPTAKRRWKCV